MNTLEHEILSRFKNNTLLDFLVHKEPNTNGETGTDVIALLIKLHNAGAIDFLSFAKNLETADLDWMQHLEFQSVFARVLPALEAQPATVLLVASSLMAFKGKDVSATYNFDALRDWCSRDHRADVVLEYVHQHRLHTYPFTVVALQAGALQSIAEYARKGANFLEHHDSEIRAAALNALGSMKIESDPLLLAEILSSISSYLDSETDDSLLAQGLRSVLELHSRSPDLTADVLTTIIARMQIAGAALVRHEAATATWRHEKLAEHFVENLLAICRDTPPTDTSTLDAIDFATSRLFNRGQVQQSVALVSFFLEKHAEQLTLKKFDNFALEVTRQSNQCGLLIIDWLLSGTRSLGDAASDLLSTVHSKPLEFDVSISNLKLTSLEVRFLSRKIIGHLFIHFVSATSLLLNIARQSQSDDRDYIMNLVFDPILINYSGGAAAYLETVRDGLKYEMSSHVESILTRLKDYLEKLSAPGNISELAPSSQQRYIVHHQREREMLEARKRAEEQSILRTLATRSVILHGARAINYVTDLSGNQRRAELKMHKIGHSVEYPRLSVIDPTGLNMMLTQFQMERRPS